MKLRNHHISQKPIKRFAKVACTFVWHPKPAHTIRIHVVVVINCHLIRLYPWPIACLGRHQVSRIASTGGFTTTAAAAGLVGGTGWWLISSAVVMLSWLKQICIATSYQTATNVTPLLLNILTTTISKHSQIHSEHIPSWHLAALICWQKARLYQWTLSITISTTAKWGIQFTCLLSMSLQNLSDI